MHRVLERQIKRFLKELPADMVAQWTPFFEAISDTYTHGDEDRTLLTHSLEISSKEFVELNKKLRSENEIIEATVRERTRELTEEQTKLGEIARHMATGAILLDAQGSVTFVNTAAAGLLSPPSQDKTVEVLTAYFVGVPILEHIKRVLGGESSNVPEAEVGGKIYALSFVALGGESGVFGALIWISDITAQKLLERAKDQFIAIASHEMRTPLAIIRGNAELLLSDEGVAKNAELKEETESILRSGIRMLGIVNDFLDVQNLEEGRMVLKLELVDIVALLNEAVVDLKKIADEKSIALLLVQPPEKIPPMQLDRARLQQVCVNLIANAIHYTQQGSITVSIQKGERELKILFTDTGLGIDVEDQARLFKKFQIGKTVVPSKEFGSGLGLYISNMLVHLMKGEVRLESSTPGKGSVFSVRLPL